MREKLIELLDKWQQYATADEHADYLIANGVTIQKWIPVTERLPKHGEVILCHLTFNELRILQWDNIYKWFLGYGSGDDWQQKNVTHWMPLPSTEGFE